ncbi:three-prime repair exonuclease I [Brevundimonas phage vB_BpoS-Papperlapapp]|uniref:Three-prime repair exonuclease I n=2 Tax=Marchewkavirus TaxID=3425052 RepID=A0A9E7MQH7_9CAUD|nr:three-prime repair exonuclease I [Brevundimonas phage vB_BpoS-Kabachok]USN14904.1 putative three-prime repair exonuclease 1 [Brevundimonas phage vB_BpoS-Domovoi]USN16277.1 three-prime repair exonuclease I [Brevundimonas phage vB_BpoS-Papperlapapp]
MNLLFFDTETTGLWDKRSPCGHEAQPRIVQIAAILQDSDTRAELMRMDLIVYRDQPIPLASSNVHGTTTAVSQAIGLTEGPVLDVFCDMVAVADVLVAHNIEFDVNIVNNAARLLSGNPALDVFQGKQQFCTMQTGIPICKFPNKNGYQGYAWPKLEDAVRKLLGREPTSAHQAIGDVIDCRDLFWFIQDHLAAERAAKAEAAT